MPYVSLAPRLYEVLPEEDHWVVQVRGCKARLPTRAQAVRLAKRFCREARKLGCQSTVRIYPRPHASAFRKPSSRALTSEGLSC
jgi:hypothetical protein